VLNGWGIKWIRAQAYKMVFQGEAAETVLADLEHFCHARRTSIVIGDGKVDPYAVAVAEGRREVWLRIQDFTRLTTDQMRLLADQASQEENR